MSDSQQGAVFITGATGLVGGEVMRRLLDQGDRDVVALTRRPVDWDHPRLRIIHGDLAIGPLPALPADVDTIIHCAASVEFDLPLGEQRAINVAGTQRVLDAAAKLPALTRFVHVSTAYVAGTHAGVFGPDDLDRGQGFRNTYEQSKFEAEHLVRASGLPWQIMRPSIIVGDQHTGWTNAFNVVYAPLRAYSRGLMNIAPGSVNAPVDLVPIDVVAGGMLALLEEPIGSTHLLVAGDLAPTVGEFIDAAAERFDRPPALVVEPVALKDLVDGLPEDERLSARRAMDQAASLLPYFNVSCTFSDPATDAVLARGGISVPPLRDYLGVLMDYAEATRWGKRKAPVGGAAAAERQTRGGTMTAVQPTTVAFSDLLSLSGTSLGTSSWRTITQDMIDGFAALTDDEQWIHTDPVRAANGPFGGTIAHGFMTLSLATSIVTEVATFTGVSAAVNYGSDKVRFTAAVPSGSRLRGHVTFVSARRRGRQFTEVILALAYELKDGTTPCTANLVFLLSPSAPQDPSTCRAPATSGAVA